MQKRTASQHMTTQNQDVTVAGFRLLIVLFLVIWLYVNTRSVGVPTVQVLFVPFVASLLANLLLVVMAMIPATLPYTRWAIMFADWVTVGALAWFVRTEPLLALLLVGGVTLISLVRLGGQWGAINTLITALVFVGALVVGGGGVAALDGLWSSYLLPVSIIAIITAGVATLATMREQQQQRGTSDIRTAAQRRMALVKAMQERTMAITDMAQMLSSTLNYHRVLDAALNVGKLATHDNTSIGFISIVMLYRPEDRQLHIETARGLSRSDENRTIPGKVGIIGDTLTLCEPIFSGNVRQDPELKSFVSLRRARSVVTVPLRAGYDNYGVIIFASEEAFAFDERYQTFLQAIGIQTTIALQNAALYQNLADEKERLVEVEEEARRKLARDLHDGPTQAVSAIAMRMAILQSMIKTEPEKVPKELAKLEELARKTTSEIRGMMFTLRPLALESQGLNAALEQLAEKMDAIYDQQVEVLVSPDAEAIMTSHQTGTIFYIIEEAVNNARKHAQADVIRVRVTRYEDVLLVEVADEGVGFDVEAIGQNYEGRTSLGMVNLHERAELVDGTLTVESEPGKGTTISVVVPVDPTGNNHNTRPSRKDVMRKQRQTFKLSAIR